MKNSPALKLAMPIMLGYLPIGLTFGLLAYQQNIGLMATMGLSMVLYAGAAQFAMLGMVAAGSLGLIPTFATIFLINLRHFILSLAYAPHTRQWTWWEKIRFFPILTDENFAVLISSSEKKNPQVSFRVSIFDYLTWAAGTLIGYQFAHFIPDPKLFGLDFALPALFIGIIVLFITSIEQIITFFSAILFMLFFYFVVGAGRSSVILAAICASFVGWRFECKRKSA